MRVVEIQNLQREEGQIFYIRKYSGNAVLELPTQTEISQIDFTIEMDGLGRKTVDLKIHQTINYPLLPLRKTITEYIIKEDDEGRLPC